MAQPRSRTGPHDDLNGLPCLRLFNDHPEVVQARDPQCYDKLGVLLANSGGFRESNLRVRPMRPIRCFRGWRLINMDTWSLRRRRNGLQWHASLYWRLVTS